MLYNIYKSYEENVANGPNFHDHLPERILPPEEEWTDFLGYSVASPLGVPAGPLLTSEWVSLAGKLGYDILTYKTIRSKEHPCHPFPNVLPVDAPPELNSSHKKLYQRESFPKNLEDIAITNSFGMPSQSPSFLQSDIPKALNSLSKGQVLVVSVVGSEEEGTHLVDDFVEVAITAKEYGAPIIEANFSCPNVSTGQGALYSDPDAVFEFAYHIKEALGDTPLILKMGAFDNSWTLREVLLSAARAGVSAISGINTLKKEVLTQSGAPALDSNRLSSGICGSPIRKTALEFIQHTKHHIDTEELPLKLIGVGGITSPEQIDLFLEHGADFAQTATGMMWDPFLAQKYHEKKQLVTRN